MKNISILILLISISGCFENEEETHTVSWFLEHKTIMNKTNEDCQNNPGELSETPNCKNSKIAFRRSRSGTSSDVHL